MSERMRGGEGERPMRFDNAYTFEEILNLISNAQPGTFTNSRGAEISVPDIMRIKTLAEGGNFVPPLMLELITRKNGLREAVVRAMAPRFGAMEHLSQINAWLNYAKTQEEMFQGITGENDRPLKIMFDSSGNAIDMVQVTKSMEYILDFLKQFPGQEIPNDNFFNTFTSKYGLRDAIKKAFTLARSGGPV